MFVVDTEDYAGNFEREMCGFMTGYFGDCGVGGEESDLFYEQMRIDRDINPFKEYILQQADEHGCARPVTVFPTEGWFNHGMGGHFQHGQEEEAQKDHIEKITEYANKHKLPDDDPFRKKAFELAKLTKFDATLSVAIFFSKKPTREHINLLMNRAKAFVEQKPCKDWADFKSYPRSITGFRLIEEKLVHETTIIGEI